MQTLTPDELRGRLTVTYYMVVVGGPFIGDLESGVVAGATSAKVSVVSGGVLCLVGLVVAATLFPQVWRYRGRTPTWRPPSPTTASRGRPCNVPLLAVRPGERDRVNETSTARQRTDPARLTTHPPVGEVPATMLAQVIRPERYGDPRDAFAAEEIPTPRPRARRRRSCTSWPPGVNYNNVWAALGRPVDVVAARRKAGATEDFHIGGSDASGVVYAVGEGVDNVRVGDQVVVHCGQWDAADPFITGGGDPITAPSARIWGYETNWGSFAQFTLVQAHQLLPKPPGLSWAAAAAYMLVGATAYRMLCGWEPHTVRENDVVLVWGGSGGLGSQAIQIVRARGGIPVAVASGKERGEFCVSLGAAGYIDRNDFDHWGLPAGLARQRRLRRVGERSARVRQGDLGRAR